MFKISFLSRYLSTLELRTREYITNRFHIKKVWILCVSFLLITGCSSTSLVILSGAGLLGLFYEINQSNIVYDDDTIYSKIKMAFEKNKKFSSINIEVEDGYVKLSGNVETQMDRITVTRIAWESSRPKKIDNNLSFKKDYSNSQEDIVIASKIRNLWESEYLPKSGRYEYSIEAYKGIIYVIGIDEYSGNSEIFVKNISTLEYVKGVKNFVRKINA